MKILLVGMQGMLSQELVSCFSSTEFDVVNFGLPELDITDEKTVRRVFATVRPNLVINAAAYTAVDLAETQSDIAYAVNRDGPKYLGKNCQEKGVPLFHISTDYIFDGTGKRPYLEDDTPAPLGVYGRSKWAGELAVREYHDKYIIIRTSWLYSAYGKNFLKTMLHLGKERTELRVINDQYGCPTSAKDLALTIYDLCRRIKGEVLSNKWGVYHYCGRGTTTWFDFACFLMQSARPFIPLAVEKIVPIATKDYATAAQRPAYSVLDCRKIFREFGISTNDWKTSARQCIEEIYA